MSVPSWPATLPQTLLVSNYQGTFPNTSIRTKMDSGPDKVRREMTANAEPVSGSVVMSTAQLATFRTFFETTLLGGSLRFTWDAPLTGDEEEFRFTDTPTWAAVGSGYFEVNLPMEILP